MAREAIIQNIEISIIVLNWNDWKETIRCLEEFLLSSPKNVLFTIVENGSENDSAIRLSNFLKKSFSTITPSSLSEQNCELYSQGTTLILFARYDNNGGFSGGMNRGITRSQTFNPNYYVLLNNDAAIAYNDICELIICSKKNGNSLTGPVIFEYNDRNIVNFSGRKWPQLLFGTAMDSYDPQENEPWQTGYIEASALLLPTSFVQMQIKKTGSLFDEKYFLYCEDVDLSLSAQALGFKCIINPKAQAYHKVSHSSGGRGNLSAYYYITRNRIYLVGKWLSPLQRIIFHMYYITSRLALCLLRLRSGKGISINGAVIKGLKDGYLNRLGKRSFK